ncbi:MAG TPA: transcriptional repressor LexA [Gemmatimonadaceae bacterium]
MTQALTVIERKVYHYLLDFLTENTYQPSVREIGRRFRIKSTKTVSEILQSLANKGYIERDPSRSRGVRLLGYEGVRRTAPVPLYGKIAAGEPALLPENRLGFITMDRRFIPNETTFFFRVMGDSMSGRGVYDGDYVMIDPDAKPKDGDIVAARLGKDATVKLLEHRNGSVILAPTDPGEREIVVKPGDDCAMLGQVCGVFRPFQELEHEPEGEPAE